MVCLPNRGLRRRSHTERGKNKSKNTRDINAKKCASSSTRDSHGFSRAFNVPLLQIPPVLVLRRREEETRVSCDGSHRCHERFLSLISRKRLGCYIWMTDSKKKHLQHIHTRARIHGGMQLENKISIL